MRMKTILVIAAATLVAAPAAAQNTSPANTTDMTSATTVNTTGATTTGDVGNAAAPAGAATTPGAQPATVTTQTNTAVETGNGPPTEPKEKKGFPWGVIGLLGLLGFIPRTRRRN